MTDDAPADAMTLVLAALAALGSLLFGQRADASTPRAPVVLTTPAGELVVLTLMVDTQRLDRAVTVRQQRAMLAIAEKALKERLPKLDARRTTHPETGLPQLEVTAPASMGLTQERLEALVTSTGEFLFQAVATERDLEGSGTSLAAERILVEAWRRRHPDASISRFARVARKDGGPNERVRWASRTDDATAEVRLVPLLVDERPDWRFSGADFDSFRIARDHRGFAAIGFTVRDDRARDFRAYTTFHLDRQVAAVVGDRVLTMPVIAAPLPSGGVISGGAEGFSDAEASDLVTVLSHPLAEVPLFVAPADAR